MCDSHASIETGTHYLWSCRGRGSAVAVCVRERECADTQTNTDHRGSRHGGPRVTITAGFNEV